MESTRKLFCEQLLMFLSNLKTFIFFEKKYKKPNSDDLTAMKLDKATSSFFRIKTLVGKLWLLTSVWITKMDSTAMFDCELSLEKGKFGENEQNALY